LQVAVARATVVVIVVIVVRVVLIDYFVGFDFDR
jgi:hypothetical protein